MIFDSLENRHAYALGPIWHAVTDYLAELDADAPLGKHHVAGCEIRVTRAETRPFSDGRYETHRRMADVQIALSGSEWFFYAPAAQLPPDGDFNDDRDLGFHLPPAREGARLTLTPGMFALVFPRDAHMPLIAVDNAPAPILKAVAKIPLELLLRNCDAFRSDF